MRRCDDADANVPRRALPQGKASHRDLLDLHLLPLRTGGLAPVGGHATPYLVAGARAQTLLPHLAPRFVHPLCVETAAGAPLFTDAAFVRAAKLQVLLPPTRHATRLHP